MTLLGCKRDPVSDRDYRFADYRSGFDRRIGEQPVECARLLQFAEVRQQLGQSCVGEWVAQAQGIRDRAGGMDVRYSALACYKFAVVEELTETMGEGPPGDWTYSDQGTYLRAAARAVGKWGFVIEGDLKDGCWPHKPSVLLKTPSMRALNNARPSRGHVYLRITGSADERAADIEKAIRAGFPVGISIQVDDEILNWTGSGAINKPRGKVIGLHALTACAVRSDGCFGVVSTWSAAWGDHGIAWVSSIALNPSDIWVLGEGVTP